MAELRGPVYDLRAERRKKSELVEALVTLFAEAADGRIADRTLAERANAWLPANLRTSGDDAKDIGPAIA